MLRARDRGQDPTAEHEHPYVAAVVVDGPLEVEHAPDRLDRLHHPVRHLLVRYPDHAEAHGTEERLDDHVAQPAEGRHRLLRALAHDGLGRRQPALLEQGRGPELVHRALDGARRVHHAHAALGQPVQGVHAEDDLFQGTGGNDPGEDDVGSIQLGRPAPEAGAAAQRRRQSLVGHQIAGVPSGGQRPGQLLGVPPLPGGENDGVHTLLGFDRGHAHQPAVGEVLEVVGHLLR